MSIPRTPLYHFWQPRYWGQWLGLGLLRLLVMLPRSGQLAAGRSIGRLIAALPSKRRHIAERNIALCFPELSEAEQATLLRKHFESLGMIIIEMGMTWWSSDEEIAALIKVQGWENIRQVQESGRGVLILSGHFGPGEFTGRALKFYIPAVSVLYRRSSNAMTEEVLRRCRSKVSTSQIPKDSVRSLVRALRNGEVVWYAPDQSYTGKNSVLAPFFGEPAMTTPATGQIAKMGNAAVVPYYPRRLSDGSGYVVEILPPLENFPSDDPKADAARISRLLEEFIRKAPEQYYWVHRRFKGRPEELGDPYA